MNLIDENLKLKIIGGKPILLEKINCFFIHRTLEEIIDFGLEDFYRIIQLFKLSNKELQETFNFPIDNFFYLLLNLNNQTQLSSLIEKAFYFFIGVDNINVNLEEKFFICKYKDIDNIKINQEGFEEIIKYIDIIYEGNRIQEDDDDSNLSEAERRMKEKLHKHADVAEVLLQKVSENEKERKAMAGITKLAREKAKTKKEGNTQFSDLIGGFWSKSNMSWEEVLHLPYYTFYFLLERLKITDNYETQLRCMLAGADMKDKPLHHWLEGQSSDEE